LCAPWTQRPQKKMSFVAAHSPDYGAQYALQYAAPQYGQYSQPQYAGYVPQQAVASAMPTAACGYPSTTTAATYGAPTYGAPAYGVQSYGTSAYASPGYDAAGSTSYAYASPAYDTSGSYGGSATYAIQQSSAAPVPTLPTAESMVAYPSMPSAMNGPFQFYPNDAPGGPGSSARLAAAQASQSAYGAGQASMNSSAMNTAGGSIQSSMDHAGNAASTMAASAPGGKHGKVSANKNSLKKASGKKKKGGCC